MGSQVGHLSFHLPQVGRPLSYLLQFDHPPQIGCPSSHQVIISPATTTESQRILRFHLPKVGRPLSYLLQFDHLPQIGCPSSHQVIISPATTTESQRILRSLMKKPSTTIQAPNGSWKPWIGRKPRASLAPVASTARSS